MSLLKEPNFVSVSGTIYGSTITSNSELILDIRNQEQQTISYVSIDLDTFKVTNLRMTNSTWWTKLISADSECIYLTKYLDRSDPNSKVYTRINRGKNILENIEEIPSSLVDITYPVLYEVGTDHHKTVSTFLSLELPLSCEYLEWEEKIIISYYLRSGNTFDRLLLLLDNGKKEWKLQQDREMKGFSSGAFFIHNNQLIFFKELNEVCIYTL